MIKILIRTTLLLLVVTTLLNCNKKANESTEENPPVNTDVLVKYLALGDSYTIGESVAQKERYPIQLARKLNADNIKVDSTLIIAQTGWRTDDLMNAIDQFNLTDTFDLVSLLIGVNNQFQGKPIAQYETEFAELLSTAIAFAGGDTTKVFVVSIPDYGYTPFGENNQEMISPEIDLYNGINKNMTEDLGISWFNITPISRNGLTDPTLVAPDNLHPSGEMYRQWVELFYAEVKGKLE